MMMPKLVRSQHWFPFIALMAHFDLGHNSDSPGEMRGDLVLEARRAKNSSINMMRGELIGLAGNCGASRCVFMRSVVDLWRAEEVTVMQTLPELHASHDYRRHHHHLSKQLNDNLNIFSIPGTIRQQMRLANNRFLQSTDFLCRALGGLENRIIHRVVIFISGCLNWDAGMIKKQHFSYLLSTMTSFCRKKKNLPQQSQ